MNKNLQQMTKSRSYYQWKRDKKKSKSRVVLTEEDKLVREGVWNFLLNNNQEDKYNAYQRYNFFRYSPKPNPKDADSNEAAILLREAQGKFLQMKDIRVSDDIELYHLDLNSAYLTALANIKHSLKYKTKYDLVGITKLRFDEYARVIHDYVVPNQFNIVKIHCTMPYNKYINIFTPNTKIRYKGKPITDNNTPSYGEMVEVRVELFVNNNYKLDSWKTWWELFRDYEVVYKTTTVWVYDLVKRPDMFDIEDVKILLDEISTMTKAEKRPWKQAIVSFTGMLAHIDPGRRLLMLISTEEVIRRLFLELNSETDVFGLQIDAIYFKPYNWTIDPVERAYQIGREVYGLKNYSPERFSKLELWDGKKFKETKFRLQEV